MITILSPAKKLDEKSNPTTKNYSQPVLLEDSKILVNEIRNLSPDDIQSIMKVSRDIAEMNFERYARWNTPFDLGNAKQAILMFNGQAYNGLDAKSMKEKELEFAKDHVRILSGLYGMLRPLDLIQSYRLEMGTKLANSRGADLYEFWGNKITNQLNEDFKKHDQKYLINLASEEYFKSINPKKLDAEIITPVFKEKKGQQYKTIAVYAKKARGMMTRFIIDHQIEEPEALKSFDLEGYHFNADLSTKKQWVFTR
jgi:hypothetical protein